MYLSELNSVTLIYTIELLRGWESNPRHKVMSLICYPYTTPHVLVAAPGIEPGQAFSVSRL